MDLTEELISDLESPQEEAGENTLPKLERAFVELAFGVIEPSSSSSSKLDVPMVVEALGVITSSKLWEGRLQEEPAFGVIVSWKIRGDLEELLAFGVGEAKAKAREIALGLSAISN